MSIGALIDPNTVSTGFTESLGPPTFFGDIASASFQNTMDNYNSNSGMRLLANELSASYDTYERLTGKSMKDLKPSRRTARHGTPEDRHRKYDEEIARLKEEDPEYYADLRSFAESKDAAHQVSQESREAFEQTLIMADPNTGTTLPTLAGGMGAAFLDPVNIAASLATAPMALGSTVTRAMAKEAVANMAVEAAIQPGVAEYQRELGQEYTTEEILMNVATAGLFGGAIGGTLKAAGKAANRFLGSSENVPEHIRDQARMQENNDNILDNNPGTARDVDEHVNNTVKASQVMESGRRVEPADISRLGSESFLEGFSPTTVRLWEASKAEGADVDALVLREIADEATARLKELRDNPNYAPITRGEVKQLKAQIKELEASINKPPTLADLKKKIKEDNPRIRGRAAEKLAKRQQAEYVNQQRQLKDALEDKIARGSKVKEAEADIDRLRQGKVPEKYQPLADTMKSNISKLDAEYQKIPEGVAETKGAELQRELEEMNVLPQTHASTEAVQQQLDMVDSPEYAAQVSSDFKILVDSEPSATFIDADTGQEMTIKQLQERFDAEDAEFAEMTSCGTGGAA